MNLIPGEQQSNNSRPLPKSDDDLRRRDEYDNHREYMYQRSYGRASDEIHAFCRKCGEELRFVLADGKLVPDKCGACGD